MAFREYNTVPGIPGDPAQKESFHININKGTITAFIMSYSFLDKDTNLFVEVVPALQISGYGETREQANVMLKEAINEFNDYMLALNHDKVEAELRRLGWKKSVFKNKQYSKTYVDVNGELQNFNAVENSIQSKFLQVA
jgi:hypothetical protein